MKVLITGAAGFLGSHLVSAIQTNQPSWDILACDIREPILISPTDDPRKKNRKYNYLNISVTDRVRLLNEIKQFKPDSIVHLASILNPPHGMTEEVQREIDVEGTRNILDAAILSKTRQIVISSSGAAYGYHKDNPEWISESDAIRGHDGFAYSRHKRQVENILANYRETHPKLGQLILRPGTILGKSVNNLITDLFQKKTILGVSGSESPFVFIWDEDVVEVMLIGIRKKKTGIYNLAGDGYVTLPDIAKILGKPFTPIPPWILKAALGVLRSFKFTQYGPEQIDFLRYRPVLSNSALKEVFGYKPRYTSLRAFYEFLRAKGVPFHELK